MKRFLSLALIVIFALSINIKSYACEGKKDTLKQWIKQEVSLNLYTDEVDTAKHYTQLMTVPFYGKTLLISEDTIIIRVKTDSLDRAFHFFKILGKVKKKKIVKTDLTAEWYRLNKDMEPVQKELNKAKDLLIKARFDFEAIEAEKKYMAVDEVYKPLAQAIKMIEWQCNYTDIRVVFVDKSKKKK